MDGGLYKVTATNSAGVASCQATLSIKPNTINRASTTLNKCAELALDNAGRQFRRCVSSPTQTQQEEKEEQEKNFVMPYNIPESRTSTTSPTLDTSITSYTPLSARKWYRSSKKAAEQINPAFESSFNQTPTRRHTKQLLYPSTEGLIPQRRVKADLNIVTDNYRTVESIMTSNDSTKRPVDTSFDDADDASGCLHGRDSRP